VKVIGPEGGRVIGLFAAEEIRSPAGLIASDFVHAVKERYKFQSIPDITSGDLSNLSFKTGEAEIQGRRFAIREFVLLTQGAVADALTTDDAEAFLRDLLEWGMQTFGWREPITLNIRYFSAVVVEFDEPILDLLKGFRDVCGIFNAALWNNYGLKQQYGVRNLTFSCDPAELPSSAVATDVGIQRRLEIPFSANRFYCNGPFKSAEFINLLERAEAALKAAKAGN